MSRALIIDNRSEYLLGNRSLLLETLVQRGFEVHVATLTTRPEHRARLQAMGITHHTLADRAGALGHVLALKRLLRAVDADVTHAFTLRAGLLTAAASFPAWSRPLLVSVTGLGYTFASNQRRAKLLRFAMRIFIGLVARHRVAVWVFQNEDDLELFNSEFGIRSEACALVRGSGVDVHELTPLPRPDPAASPRIVFIGRLLRDKGIREFVEAARLVEARGLDAVFIAAGDIDPNNPSSVSQSDIERWRHEGSVRFVGYAEDVPGLMGSASIVCLPSYREGLPKVLLEAGALERAIVTTDVPGCRDVVAPGVSGILVPPRDASALAEALAYLVDHPERRRAMGRAGRRIVEKEFGVDRVVGDILDVYYQRLGVSA